jgi:hypothetical protein
MDSIAGLTAALAAIPDHQLHFLRATIDQEPVIVPGLSAWLEAATAWEISRRAGARFDLPDPCAAIAGGEVECSLVALAILGARFREAAGVAHFLDTTAAVLCADASGSSRHVH